MFLLKISASVAALLYTNYYLYKSYSMYKSKRTSACTVPKEAIEALQFDLNNISVGDNILIIGKRCTGKTTLISKILDSNKNRRPGIIVSPADSFERHYEKKYIENENIIHHQYSQYLMNNFIQLRIKNIISDIADFTVCYTVLDNCLLNTVDNDKNLSDLLINGYFYKTINILSISNPYSNAADFRTKMDYVFILKDTHLLSSKKIYDDYFKYLIAFDTYKDLVSRYTQDYHALVIDYNNGGKIYFF